MVCLLRYKIVFVVKYFRRNHFKKKWFSQKYFQAFSSYEKITKYEKAIATGIRQRPIAVARFLPDLSHFGQISDRIRPNPARSVIGSVQIQRNQWSDPFKSGHFGQSRPNQWPNPSRSGWNSGRINGPDPVRSGLLLTMAGFWPVSTWI
jgi:hypothetical protein